MTTTGGPEHFLADSAINDRPPDDRVVSARPEGFDGDDIIVEPGAPQSRSRRVRLATAGAVAALLLVGGMTVAVAHRDHARRPVSSLRSVSPPSPPPARPTRTATAVKPTTKRTIARPHTQTPVPKTTASNVAPPATNAVPATTPTVAIGPPPVTAAPIEPTTVLEWSATPSELSVKRGAQLRVTVTVVNPTAGTVTLGTPLSCAPTMRGPRGATIGGPMCEQITQTMQPHTTLTQQYTLYATNTGNAAGNALSAGTYTATVENQFKMTVHVTKA